MKLTKPPHCMAAFVLIVALCLGGCALPKAAGTEAAPLEVPANWSRQQVTLTDEATDLSQWWLWFSDPLLTQLVEQALDANTAIAAARSAVRQAAALRDSASATKAPTVGYSTSAQRSATGESASSDKLSAGLDASWNPDISGARQSAVEASDANLLAVQAKLGSVQGSVASDVALTYIALRASQTRLATAQESLSAQLEILQMTRWRYAAGMVGAVEVEQATVAAGQTRAQIPALELTFQKSNHALAVQLGKPPAALLTLLTPASAVPHTSQTLIFCLPKDVLRQRPDVRAAKHQVDKALADVAQAKTLRNPELKLGSALGVGAASFKALSGAGAAIGSLVMGMSGVLFDGGAAVAQLRAQQAALELAQTNDRTTTLMALQDIEDAMTALHWDTEHLQQIKQVSLAAGNAATMAQQRYAAGLVDYQIVLETQRSLLTSQDTQAVTAAAIKCACTARWAAVGVPVHLL